MKLLLVCIANETPRNANVIHLISCNMVSPTVAKIYKLISQSHEFYKTVIVFIIANDVKIETWPFTIFLGNEISEIHLKYSNRAYETCRLFLVMHYGLCYH